LVLELGPSFEEAEKEKAQSKKERKMEKEHKRKQ